MVAFISQRKIGRAINVPHKSPGNNAFVEHESGLKQKSVQMPSRVPRSLSLNLDIFADDVKNDDVSMDDSFIKLGAPAQVFPPKRFRCFMVFLLVTD